MTGVTLPASISSLRATRSSWFVDMRKFPSFWLPNWNSTAARTIRPPLAIQRWSKPPPFGTSVPVGRERTAEVGQRVVRHVVEDEVVLLPAPGEVLHACSR